MKAIVQDAYASQRLRSLTSKERTADLVVLKELIEAGKVTPVVDLTYPLSETAEAIRYLRAGRVRGKLVVTL